MTSTANVKTTAPILRWINNNVTYSTSNINASTYPSLNVQIDFNLLFSNKTKTYKWEHYNHMMQKIITKLINIHLFVSKNKLILKY